jgi:hypothetical protein
MKLILKISAGVFVGVFAVLLALAIPKWRAQWRYGNATLIMDSLTPEQLIARCGKPAPGRDQTTAPRSEAGRLRSMVYDGPRDPDSGKPTSVIVLFGTLAPYSPWHFLNLSVGVPGEPELSNKIDSPVEQLQWLPCVRHGSGK